MRLRILGIIRDQKADKFLFSGKCQAKFLEFVQLMTEGEHGELVNGQRCVQDLIREVVSISSSTLHDLGRILREEVSSRDIVRDKARCTAIASFSGDRQTMQCCKVSSRGIGGGAGGRSRGWSSGWGSGRSSGWSSWW